MLSFYNIWTVARYELKTLSRSWFFRIFAGLSLVLLTLFTVFVLTLPFSPYAFRALGASIPYLNFKILNVLQAIIVVFLATDFLKRDRKLDSTEVFYARSMTNTDYIIGKTLGILIIFLILNVLFMLVDIFIHTLFAQVNFSIIPYLIYVLFFSIPSLIFIIGLTLVLMSLIKNQAVTFVLVFAVIGVSLFFLTTKYNSLFDFLAFFLPSMYSDFVGLAIPSAIFIHRLSYLFLGFSGILFCAVMLKRLIQSTIMRRLTSLFAVSFLAIGIIGLVLWNFSHRQAMNSRDEIRQLTKDYASEPAVTILAENLDVNHDGKRILSQAKIVFANKNNVPVERLIFSLNKGLTIKSIRSDQGDLAFERKSQYVLVTPARALAANSVDSLTIEYSGQIDEQSIYTEVDEDLRSQPANFWLIRYQPRFAFIENDYLLLTPACLWYPIAGIPYGANYPELGKRDFIKFQVSLTTSDKLTVISQGAAAESDTANGQVRCHFIPEVPLTGVSLIAGNYEQRSIEVDSIRYALYNLKSHNFYLPYFTELGDTVAALIRDVKNNYEITIGITFPYSRLELVETPVQFYAFPRPWTLSQESIQPELVLLPESGVFLENVDFRQMERFADRRRERSGQTLTAQENQANQFQGFLNANLTNLSRGRNFFMQNIGNARLNYNVFSNYYYHANNIYSKEWPILNQALESYIRSRIPDEVPSFIRTIRGLSDEEKANLVLNGASLKDALLDSTNKEIQQELITHKGNYLFSLLKYQLGEDNFNNFLKSFLEKHRFTDVSIDEFNTALKSNFKFDFLPYFQRWYSNTQLPGYLVTGLTSEKIMDGERMRYQTRFTIENGETVPGLIQLNFYGEGGRGGRFMGRMQPQALLSKLVFVQPNERKEIGLLLDEAPRRLELNTLISRNIPSVINERFPDKQEVNNNAKPFEGEKILTAAKNESQIEIVVDNEDPGFEILTTGKESLLQKLFQSSEDSSKFNKYGGVFYWQPPGKWKPVSDENFYGKYIHSAHVIKKGSGDQKVAWNAELPESGQYEVFYYPGQPEMPPWMRRGRDRDEQPQGEYHLIIKHDDGEEEVELDLANLEEGWNSLGTFYFSAGSTRVVLTDQTKGKIVFADAVKWVKR